LLASHHAADQGSKKVPRNRRLDHPPETDGTPDRPPRSLRTVSKSLRRFLMGRGRRLRMPPTSHPAGGHRSRPRPAAVNDATASCSSRIPTTSGHNQPQRLADAEHDEPGDRCGPTACNGMFRSVYA
jgi:hypothetical protein